MSEPTEKAPAIREMLDDLSKAITGRVASESIKEDICVRCGKPVTSNSFTDECSRREYRITGLCQVCQDQIFGSMEE
jgi:hypothetical protein